jgi:hypothetical protein
MDLQNCMDILKSEPGSSIGTCQISSDDGNYFVGIKVEDVTDVKEEEDPGPAPSTGIKTEPAVSCMCVCFEVYVYWTDNVQTICTFGFIASLDILHYYCDIPSPFIFVYLKEEHEKFDHSRK